MDIAPIAGIRSVSLFESRRVEKEFPPRFEIDASSAAEDETCSEDREAPEREIEESEGRLEQFDGKDEPAAEAALEPEPGEGTINLMA